MRLLSFQGADQHDAGAPAPLNDGDALFGYTYLAPRHPPGAVQAGASFNVSSPTSNATASAVPATNGLPSRRLPIGATTWATTAIIVLFLAVCTQIRHTRAKRRRRRMPAATSSSHECDGGTAGFPARKARTTEFEQTLSRVRIALWTRAFPAWLYGPETLADALWTLAYCILTMIFTFWNFNKFEIYAQQHIANLFGYTAFVQAPIITLLAMKNNPVSWLTGIPYQNLNYLHRASSRVMLLWSWIHVGLSIPFMIKWHYTYWAFIIWGWAAIAGYTLLWVTSFAVIRRRFHQFFFATHVIFALLYLVGAFFHWRPADAWILFSLALWLLDRLIRIVKTTLANHVWRSGRGQCRVELFKDNHLRITAVRPGLNWKAGQHVFISAPWLSKDLLEAHPFTISNIPNAQNEVIILARTYKGFTRHLCDSIEENGDSKLKCYLDGPYGSAHQFDTYDTILMVAGGTGVAPMTANILALLETSSRHPERPHCQSLHLVWVIKHASALQLAEPVLNKIGRLAEDVKGRTEVIIDLHVTGIDSVVVDSGVASRRSSMVGNFPSSEGSYIADGRCEDQDDCTSFLGKSVPSSESGFKMLPTLTKTETNNNEDVAATEVEQATESAVLLHHHDNRRWDSESTPFGLSKAARRIVGWHSGRPDIEASLQEDALQSQGSVAVLVCGPAGLFLSTRQAVRRVSEFTWSPSIDYLEESIGS